MRLKPAKKVSSIFVLATRSSNPFIAVLSPNLLVHLFMSASIRKLKAAAAGPAKPNPFELRKKQRRFPALNQKVKDAESAAGQARSRAFDKVRRTHIPFFVSNGVVSVATRFSWIVSKNLRPTISWIAASENMTLVYLSRTKRCFGFRRSKWCVCEYLCMSTCVHDIQARLKKKNIYDLDEEGDGEEFVFTHRGKPIMEGNFRDDYGRDDDDDIFGTSSGGRLAAF